MLWRNMAAMAAEEMFRANPIDGVVLLGGCDKTIPALLMAAASVDLPAVVVPGGPMLSGHFRGVRARLRHRRVAAVGGGPRGHADRAQFLQLGVVDDPQPRALQHDGHRLHDGLMAEALGMVLPGLAGTRRPTAGCCEGAHDSGRLGVEMVATGRTAQHVLTRARSSTRSSRWPRSAARRTPWCTCWRSPVGSASS